MNALRLPEKDPGETLVLCWDFTEDLEEQDSPELTITGIPDIAISVDQSLRRGTDSNVGDMLVGSPQVVGNQVLQAVTLGVDGVDYKIRCAVSINSSPTVVLYKTSLLPVRVQ